MWSIFFYFFLWSTWTYFYALFQISSFKYNTHENHRQKHALRHDPLTQQLISFSMPVPWMNILPWRSGIRRLPRENLSGPFNHHRILEKHPHVLTALLQWQVTQKKSNSFSFFILKNFRSFFNQKLTAGKWRQMLGVEGSSKPEQSVLLRCCDTFSISTVDRMELVLWGPL